MMLPRRVRAVDARRFAHRSPPSQHGLTLFAASHWPSPTLADALASAQSKHLCFAVVPGTSLQLAARDLLTEIAEFSTQPPSYSVHVLGYGCEVIRPCRGYIYPRAHSCSHCHQCASIYLKYTRCTACYRSRGTKSKAESRRSPFSSYVPCCAALIG